MTSPSPTTSAPGHPSHRRPLRGDIEGLRAVAVLTVLLYHLHVPWVPGGFAGVDVFFVISGFLITSLLIREFMRSGTISLTDFYARRARRLLPAASVVILVTLVAGWFVMPARARPDLVSDALGATLYVVNWVLAGRSVDYLAEDAVPSPLQHYWSLSVEEQFYVVWPLLILLALTLAARLRLRRGRVAFLLLAALGVASFVWSVVQTAAEPATAYFVTTTRLWELAAGALLAFAVPRLGALPRAVSEVLVLLGLGMILVGMVTVTASTPWPGSAALLPVLGSVLVIAAGVPRHDTLGGRVLSLPAMVWIGGLSYAIYLWHWPLVVLAEARFGELSVPTLVGLGLLSVLLAWLTKHLVEDPVRFQRSLSAAPWRSLVLGGTTMTVLCALALAGWASLPRLGPDDVRTDGPAALVANPTSRTWELREDLATAYTTSGALAPDPALAVEDIPSYYADDCQIEEGDPEPGEHCVYGVLDSTTEVVLWGDSKLGQYFSSFEAIAQEEGWRLTTYLKSACPPTLAGAVEPECDEFGRAVLDELLDRDVPPAAVIVGTGAGTTPTLEDGMTDALRPLQEAGVPIVVVADNKLPEVEDGQPWKTVYDCAAARPDSLLDCSFTAVRSPGGPLLTAVTERLDPGTVDLLPWICPDEESCPVAIGGELIYRQGSHITDTYARSLTPFLHRQLLRLGLGDTDPAMVSLADVPPRAEDR